MKSPIKTQRYSVENGNTKNVNGKAKPYQVKQFIKIIEKYNLLEERAIYKDLFLSRTPSTNK